MIAKTKLILTLAVLLSLTSCAFTKAVLKDPGNRNTIYGDREKIIQATTTALESHHYVIQDSNTETGWITGRSPNEGEAKDTYKGYQLTAKLSEGPHGGTNIDFDRELIIEAKGKRGKKTIQEKTPAPNNKLNQNLLRQIRNQVMR
jgi:hypothetical protein